VAVVVGVAAYARAQRSISKLPIVDPFPLSEGAAARPQGPSYRGFRGAALEKGTAQACFGIVPVEEARMCAFASRAGVGGPAVVGVLDEDEEGALSYSLVIVVSLLLPLPLPPLSLSLSLPDPDPDPESATLSITVSCKAWSM